MSKYGCQSNGCQSDRYQGRIIYCNNKIIT